jgi:hypothetical protein
MDLDGVLAALDLGGHHGTFSDSWEESEACFPYPHPEFLSGGQIRAAREMAGLPRALDPALLEVARKTRAHEPLCHLAWHCYRLLYHCPAYAKLASWPLATAALGDAAGGLWLLLTLASLPRMQEIHCARGIPQVVTDAMAEDYRIGVSRFARFHQGRLGCPHNGWYRNHFSGNMARLGRLQYIVNPWRFAVRVFRHTQTGEVLALSEPGVRYTGEGFVDSIPGRGDPVQGFTSKLAFDGCVVRGNPILPTGTALPQEIGLAVSVWRDAVKRDDALLAMHIPEGGGMTLDKCRASMQEAFPFFARHYPEAPVKGIMCASWIFSPEYESFYSSEANFVRYQRELYLFPTWSSGKDGVYFVFDLEDCPDPKELARDSSLRRAMADRLEKGEVLRSGGMFFLPDALPRFGAQPYRSQSWVAAVRGGDRNALAASGIMLL